MSRSRSNSRSNSRSRSRSGSVDNDPSKEQQQVKSTTTSSNNASEFRLYARGFPSSTVEPEVREVFEACGKLADFAYRSTRSDGSFCFVKYEDEEGFKSALALNGQAFKDSTLVVEVRKMKSCFLCKEHGHIAAMCPKGRQNRNDRDRRGPGVGANNNRNFNRVGNNNNNNGGAGRAITCFNCGREGHMSRQCPNDRKREREVVDDSRDRRRPDDNREKRRDRSRERRRSHSRRDRSRSRRRDDSRDRRRRDDSRDRRRRD